MKKILFVIISLLMTLNVLGQIIGITNLNVGQETTLSVNFNNSHDSNVSWAKYGNSIALLSAYGSTISIKAVTPGLTSLNAYLISSSGNIKEMASIQIMVNANPTAPKISGATLLRTNSIYTFKISTSFGMEFKEWFVNEQYFEKISESVENLNYILTVKTKDKLGNTGITATTKKDSDILYSYLDITIAKPSYAIKVDNQIVCENELIQYTLEGVDDTDVIYWEAGSNMALISGQGASIANFKGSGNGEGRVKVTIKNSEKSYFLENSQVWVGVPKISPQVIISEAYCGDPYEIYMESVPGATGYRSSWDHIFYDKRTICAMAGGVITASYEAYNDCGSIEVRYIVNVIGDGQTPEWRSTVTSSPVSIRVLSFTTGSVVYQQKNVINFNIQTTNLKGGIYIIETTDETGKISREKVRKIE